MICFGCEECQWESSSGAGRGRGGSGVTHLAQSAVPSVGLLDGVQAGRVAAQCGASAE